MAGLVRLLLMCLALTLSGHGSAQTTDRVVGGDVYRSGETGAPLRAARDVFAFGAKVLLEGAIAQDAHVAGLDVEVDADTQGDLYAAGFSVSLRGEVGGDLTVSGGTIRTTQGVVIGGNARLTGGRVTIDGPVRGALTAAGGRVILNSEVTGDALLAAETISFGPDARILGALTYSAPERIVIPDHVLPSERISFEPYERGDIVREAHEMWSDWEYPVLPSFLSVLGGFLVTLGFFVVIGALFLTLAPDRVRHLRRSCDARPGAALLAGVIGLSLLFGLVPISAMTIVGIPLVPIVLVVVIAVWALGYVLGAYVLAMRAMRGVGAQDNPTIWIRLLALVIGVTLLGLLNFIPVLGWMANFAVVLLGAGAMTIALFERLVGNVGPALDADMRAP